MGKKYIIELLDECNSEFKGIMAFGLTQEKQISIELIPEESMTPYTEPEPHAEVTADAYQRGYEEGYKDRYNEPGKGKIQVGDEVNAPFGKAIVVNINSVAEKIWLVYADGHGGFEYFKDAPTKTGRHFPEIAEVFAKMKETDNG